MSCVTGKELSKKSEICKFIIINYHFYILMGLHNIILFFLGRTTKESSKATKRVKTRTSQVSVGKAISNQDILPDIGDLYKDSLKTAKEYEACFTTTIYGESYLGPDKCKARGFDPIK